MVTRNIKERLDELGQRLGAADFRAGEGLMNEANIRIFPMLLKRRWQFATLLI